MTVNDEAGRYESAHPARTEAATTGGWSGPSPAGAVASRAITSSSHPSSFGTGAKLGWDRCSLTRT